MSIKTKLGLYFLQTSIASKPSEASPTTSYPLASKISLVSILVIGSSSTITIVLFINSSPQIKICLDN